jgi:hypothetical protein
MMQIKWIGGITMGFNNDKKEIVTYNNHKFWKGILAVCGVIITYYLIQFLTKVLAVYPYLGFPKNMVQYGSWIQKIDHHIWQMVLAIILIGIVGRGNFRNWGFNLKNIDESIRILKRFFIYFGLYFVGVGFLVQLLFMTPQSLGHPLSNIDIFGNLVFMGLISGLSEEILFRGMMHTFLAKYFTEIWVLRGIEIPVAGFITTVIFTLAHINFKLVPFEITHLYVPQLILAFVLGLYYSVVYHRTGSLLNPIVAHNFSNATLYISTLILNIVK